MLSRAIILALRRAARRAGYPNDVLFDSDVVSRTQALRQFAGERRGRREFAEDMLRRLRRHPAAKGFTLAAAGGAGAGVGVTASDDESDDTLQPLPQHYMRNALYGAGAGVATPFMALSLANPMAWADAVRERRLSAHPFFRFYDEVYDAMGDYRREGSTE